MAISGYTFPEVYRYYDSERRDRYGSYRNLNVGPDDTHNSFNFNYVQHYTFDYSANPRHDIVLGSYANDVTIVWESEYTGDQNNQHVISGNVKVYRNGTDITVPFNRIYTGYGSSVLSVKTALVGDSEPLNAIKLNMTNLFWYTNYDHPDTLYIGHMSVHKNNASPYDPPELSGQVSITQYGTYYEDSYGVAINDLDKFIEALEATGDGTPITPILPSEDPSQPGGGDIANPDYNPFSDPVDFPGLPTGGSAIASGFIRVYNPTAVQLQSLAGKLWGNDFVNTIHKIMNDPMEAMISLHSVPFQIVGGGNANIEVGNFDTEVSAKTVTTQYYQINCGNISLPEHWASALDYSPYTTVDIFIPFVGVRSLQIDDVMNKVLTLKYNVDVLTGSAVAMLKCGDSVLYTYNTQVHAEIPYTMSSYGRLVQSIIGVAGTAIGATAGGAGALIGSTMGGALGTAMTKHSDISRGGSLGGAVGVMGEFTPYLILHRPIQSLASGFASKKGYPSNISATLSSVSGYTVVDKIHLTNIGCTDTERDEIHSLLKEGVII